MNAFSNVILRYSWYEGKLAMSCLHARVRRKKMTTGRNDIILQESPEKR
ncbi:hypothetical protein MKX78_14640 [Cytobacillus sp. FSL R5-0569]